MPLPVDCQLTDWPAAGAPFETTSAWTVQVNVAPAASESCGVSEVSVAGVPPANPACTAEPFASEAVTTDHLLSAAMALIVARPSPLAVTVQPGCPHPGVANPLTPH